MKLLCVCAANWYSIQITDYGMTKEDYITLYEKRAQGRCTAAELQLLDAYESYSAEDEQCRWEEGKMGNRESIKKEIHIRLQQEILGKEISEGRIRRLWPSVAASVAALMFVSALGLWLVKDQKTSLVTEKQITGKAIDVEPGTNKAQLYLTDGSVMELDAKNKSFAAKRGRLEIKQDAGGNLICRFKDPLKSTEKEKWNILKTPKGGQYHLSLPDGSLVWLNAASSLRFSNKFNEGERTVELTGEAYFEVAKSAKPFKVMVDGAEIAVLGTHFNVMAYADEKVTKATLLEGAVKISYGSDQEVLQPGEQAALQKAAQSMQISKVDLEEVMSWQKGYFLFQNESIQQVMRKIQRWYNVEVIYDQDVTGFQFTGTISRYKNISEVLNMLTLTGIVHFKIEASPTGKQERRVIVMK